MIDKKLNHEECRQRLLELLRAFDNLCRRHQLRYFLMWGTLIGAVRHKGFIPWDDDIDVAMPREDYEKLIMIADREDMGAGFICFEINDKYPLFYGKFFDKKTRLDSRYANNIPGVGLFIDVFPIDNINLRNRNSMTGINKTLLKNEKMLNYSNMKRFWPSDNLGKSMIKFIAYSYAKIRGMEYWQKNRRKKLDQYLRKSDEDSHEYCLCASSVLKTESFGESIMLPFENGSFPCPIGYDAVLTAEYGDYRKLPPKEKQIPGHDYEVYWVESNEWENHSCYT